jgi:Holliday junction resolvasome RuvABC endonuclease subunit
MAISLPRPAPEARGARDHIQRTFLALDPAFRNIGWTSGVLQFYRDGAVKPRFTAIGVLSCRPAEANLRMATFKASLDYEAARGQKRALDDIIERTGAQILFSEVPSGGQDAASWYASGIVIGLLAGLVLPVVEVQPSDVKMVALGAGLPATDKKAITAWARSRYPFLPWQGTTRDEHAADGVLVALAGLRSPDTRSVARALWSAPASAARAG